MTQSRKMSLAESCANIALGYGIAIAAQEVIFPMYGIHLPIQSQLGMGGFFTVVSLVRSYGLRRLFNWMHGRKAVTAIIILLAVTGSVRAEDVQCVSRDKKVVDFQTYFDKKYGIDLSLNHGQWSHFYQEEFDRGVKRLADGIAEYQTCIARYVVEKKK